MATPRVLQSACLSLDKSLCWDENLCMSQQRALNTVGVPHRWLGAVLARQRLQYITMFLPQVFIRELISNGSDALEKLRHKLMSEGKVLPEMEIHLQTDSEKGTITIQVSPFAGKRNRKSLCCTAYPSRSPLEAELECNPHQYPLPRCAPGPSQLGVCRAGQCSTGMLD